MFWSVYIQQILQLTQTKLLKYLHQFGVPFFYYF